MADMKKKNLQRSHNYKPVQKYNHTQGGISWLKSSLNAVTIGKKSLKLCILKFESLTSVLPYIACTLRPPLSKHFAIGLEW